MKSPVRSNFFEVLAEEALIGLLCFDSQGRCFFANTYARSLLSWPSPFTDHCLEELIPQDCEPRLTPFSQGMLTSEGLHKEVLIRRMDGSQFIASVGVKTIETDGIFHALMLQDMTVQLKLQRDLNQKQTEIHKTLENLKSQNQKLKELDQGKSRFFALTTHELRTPLGALLAAAEILKDHHYNNPSEVDLFAKMIHEQGSHLLRLVEEILDYSKLQAGKPTLKLELVNLYETMLSVREVLQELARAQRIEIEVLAPDDLVCAFTDRFRLQQILLNLLSNAIKYNRFGGRILISMAFKEAEACVSIQDSGVGISPAHFEKIFDEFETLGRVALGQNGTGLGLPISRKLARILGGDIVLTSELNVGSTFVLHLPSREFCQATG